MNKNNVLYVKLILAVFSVCVIFIFSVGVYDNLVNSNDLFEGEIKLDNYEIIKEISKSDEISVLGNYIYLYSPHPESSPDEDLSQFTSYFIVTDFDNSIKEIIELGGYYQYMELNENGDIFVYNDSTDAVLFEYDNNYYKNAIPISSYNVNDAPVVGVFGKNSVYIDEGRYVEFINEPFSKINDHTYLVVDFIQNGNVFEGVEPKFDF